jgi:hypothetical protein
MSKIRLTMYFLVEEPLVEGSRVSIHLFSFRVALPIQRHVDVRESSSW